MDERGVRTAQADRGHTGASAGTDPCAGQPPGGENSPSGESADDPIRREDGQADVDAVSWNA